MSGIPAGAGQLLGKRLGKFEILALLALGGTAEIYLARIGGAAGFEKYVVVKCLHDHLADDAEFVKMFLDEARLAAHLDHSNIVQTMELGQHDGRYYMVMEFLAGLSLAMIIRRAGERIPTGRLPTPLVLNVLAQSCAGLHYAHEKAMNGRALNIVHRDISPQNLVISFEGVVKVVDFGIAKAEMRETHTRSGTIKGKFAYMSPEQCVANNVDRRTDVFALGVIGHELLTGRRLFKRPSPYETYQAVIACEVVPPSALGTGLDPAIDAVLMRALAKDKADRYPTAEAFGDALLGYLHHRGIGSGPGDVSRFFDAHFGQEIDEHSTRMRELISGREISMETGVTWGSDEVDEVRAAELRIAAAGDANRPGAPPGLSGLLDELGGGSRVEDDDEMPAERTRIESNPLDRITELDRVVSNAPPRRSSSRKLTRPPQAEPATAVAKLAAGARPSLPGMPPSGRFPDLANLPTMIAPDAAPELAPTATGVPALAMSHGPPGIPADAPRFPNAPASQPLGGVPAASSGKPPSARPTTPGVPPAVSSFANAPTALAPGLPRAPGVPRAASSFASAPTKLAPSPAPPVASNFSEVPTTLEPPPASSLEAPTVLGRGPAAQEAAAAQFPPAPNGARGSTSLAVGLGTAPAAHGGAAAGRAVAGNGSPASQPWPQPLAPRPHISSASPPPAGYPVMSAEMSAQIATGASVFPSESRGGGGSLRPEPGAAGPPGLPPPPPPGLGDGYPPSPASADPQRAASLMSPVGQQYPEQVDWAAAAASPARAVPPWLLVALFVGAIAVALILTTVIAKLVR